MEDLSDYSSMQQKVIKEIITNDKNFHSSYLISDLPLYGMLQELDNGETTVKKDVSCVLGTSGTDYNLNLQYSEEQKCWFYTLSGPSEEVRGVIHYNTVFNAMGDLAFAVLNDNLNDKDLSYSLPYSNILVLRK